MVRCTGYIVLLLFCPCRHKRWRHDQPYVIFSSSFLSSPHVSLNSLQLLLSVAVLLHSPPTLSRSLLTHSSHRILGILRLLFPSTFWASVFFAEFSISHSFHMTSPFLPTPHRHIVCRIIRFVKCTALKLCTSANEIAPEECGRPPVT